MFISQAARSRELFKSILIYQLFHEYSFAWLLQEVHRYCDPHHQIRGLYPRILALTGLLKLWSHLALSGNSESETFYDTVVRGLAESNNDKTNITIRNRHASATSICSLIEDKIVPLNLLS